MAIQYVFREGEPLRIKDAASAKPQVIGKALAAISGKCGGELRPREIWKAAQKPDHPLHRHYDWDVQRAAEAHWDETSRNLIRIIRIVDDDASEGTTRAFVSIGAKSGTSYRPIEDVKQSADLQLIVFRQAETDLAAWERRYREMVDVCQLVKQARETVAGKRKAAEENRSAA